MTWLDEDFTKAESRDLFLKECVNTKKFIPTGSVLQISQCVNVSVPRKNRETDAGIQDPKNSILKLTLTDGKSSLQGLMTENHPNITSSTVPGTKVEIVGDVSLVMGIIILTCKNIRVLGGCVPALIDQWRMQIAAEKLKSWGFISNRQTNDGPPLWKPFNVRGGGRIDRTELRNVKAMDIVNEQKEVKTDDPSKSKFDAQRLEAISELAKQTQMKSFGEGKRLVDKGVQDLINEGFTEEEAEQAMQRFKNPKKALKFLKNSKENSESRTQEPRPERDFSRGGRKGGRGRKNRDDDDDGPTGNELGEQPSNSINLFGFIQQKIKTEDDTSSAAKPEQNDRRNEPLFSNASNPSYHSESRQTTTRDGNYPSNGYRRNENNSRGGPPRSKDYGNPRQQQEESFRDSFYNSGSGPPRGRGASNTSRGDNFHRSDRGGRDGGRDSYDSGRQYSADSYNRQNDSRNFRQQDRYGNQGQQSRQSGPPQRNFSSSSSNPREAAMEFTNNSSHFPSLGDDFMPPPVQQQQQPPPQRREPDTTRQEYYRGGDNSYQQQQQYNSRPGRDESYRQQQQHQQQQQQQSQGYQTYPSRNRDYDAYDRNMSRPPVYPDSGRNHFRGGDQDYQAAAPPPHQQQRYNSQQQLDHKFQHLGLRSEYGSDGDWRPSQTMVFTRSKNAGGGGGGGGGGGAGGGGANNFQGSRSRDYSYQK